jgi:flagellar protein FliO/FliZ
MIGALATLPWLLKRWQQRQQSSQAMAGVSTQVLSSVVVGQQQRVVTIEVGQGTQKTCLVLGVTPQSIQCLHVLGQPKTDPLGSTALAFADAMAQARNPSATEPANTQP